MSSRNSAVSILQWSLKLRRCCPSCNNVMSSRFVPTVTTANSSFLSSTKTTTRHYATKRRIRASPAARKSLKPNNRPQFPEGREQRFASVSEQIEKNIDAIYNDVRKAGIIDGRMPPKVFAHIAHKLLYNMMKIAPNAKAVKTVYDGDPNRVYDVAVAVTQAVPWEPHILNWAATATAKAGAVIPVVLAVKHQLARDGYPERTVEFEHLERMAKETETPLAMRMYAEVLWAQRRSIEAIKMLERLHKRTYPSNAPVKLRDDLTIGNTIIPPWKRLGELYNLCGFYEKADQITKLGALEYRDPVALDAHAYLMQEQNDWNAYEQCIVMAATAGHADACLRLANYYYLIFRGDIPSPDEPGEKASLIRSFFHRLFGQSRKKEEFRKLARDWYELATLHGNTNALRNLVVLLREDDLYDDAGGVLLKLQHDKEQWDSPNIKKLRDRLYDPAFKPKIPDSWLKL